jgi:hypothetical protein
LREARNQYGDETGTRKFSDALVDYLTERKIPIPPELLQENDPNVILSKSQAQRMLEEERQRLAALAAAPPSSGSLAAE